MARLIIVLLFLAVLMGLAMGVANGVGRMAQAGRAQLARAEMGNGTMQRLSGILLLALILYVSIWGGA
ncbi:hypothetical protein [Oceaniglobus ichthyenteri]|uniref:hypothetical protein n=1 Tax=Oceaniglobus ichthyenteri TaxID=2136177 RepID=UPI000D37AC90|nr:hypothetical protein [Oceaniglobus ichthyenteri]